MILLIYQLIISIVCLTLHSQAKRVEVDWNIEYLQVNRDEYYTRKAVGVNGQLPVPPVYMTAGDTLVLNVCNSLDEPTAVHAHGIFHRGENYNDGAGM
ncbi:ferroxidase fet3, partial [Coemansia sp. RSA 1722]